MPNSGSVHCPKCASIIFVTPNDSTRKKVWNKCHNCKHVFSAKPEAGHTQNDEVFAEVPVGTFAGNKPNPISQKGGKLPSRAKQKSGSAKTASGTKKSRSKEEVDEGVWVPNPVHLTFTALGVLTVLALFLFFAIPWMKNSQTAQRFAWLPNGIDCFLQVNVNDLANSGAAKQLHQSEVWEDLNKQFVELFGTQLTNINSLTVGRSTANGDSITVIRTKAPLDRSQFQDGQSEESYSGHPLYELASRQFAFLADPRTVVVGDKSSLQRSIDSQGMCHGAGNFAFLSNSGHITFGALASNLPSLKTSADALDDSDTFNAKDLVNASFVLNVYNQADFVLTIDFSNSTAAQNAANYATEQLQQLRNDATGTLDLYHQLYDIGLLRSRDSVTKFQNTLTSTRVGSLDKQFYIRVPLATGAVNNIMEFAKTSSKQFSIATLLRPSLEMHQFFTQPARAFSSSVDSETLSEHVELNP